MENRPVAGVDRGTAEKFKKSLVQEALTRVSVEDWLSASWPVITYVSKEAFRNLGKESITGKDHKQRFWLEVFNSEKFFSLDRDNGYDSNEHFILILHSFKNRDGGDSVFKAITTTEKSLLEDPENNINYQLHGKPCEMRGGGSYPTIDFWEFYDELRDEKLEERYPIPDTQWREKFVRGNFT
jgi:hypothetical protein